MKTITVATVGLAATAATAQAAPTITLTASPCYIAGETYTVSGAGMAPNSTVTFAVDGSAIPVSQPTDAAGNYSLPMRFGQMDAVKTHTMTATDTSNPALTASVQFVGTTHQVATRNSQGKPGKKRKLRGYGFIFGPKAFMHVRGHGIKSDKFLKRPKAPCGTFTVKKAIVPANAPSGKYRVQFDHKKRYSKRTPHRQVYELTVFRTFSSAAFAPPSWSLTPVTG
jgi:hypothetical protein